jgi:hypothetical protein
LLLQLKIEESKLKLLLSKEDDLRWMQIDLLMFLDVLIADLLQAEAPILLKGQLPTADGEMLLSSLNDVMVMLLPMILTLATTETRIFEVETTQLPITRTQRIPMLTRMLEVETMPMLNLTPRTPRTPRTTLEERERKRKFLMKVNWIR